MSDHDVEDLVEASILALDACHPADDTRVRGWIGALYRVQNGFDCSDTRSRVLDVLLRRRFTFRFRPEERPDHVEREERPDHVERVASGQPFVHTDVGSSLWHHMVRVGRLTGPDAVPLREIPLIDALQAVAVAGETLGDPTLIAAWREVEPTLCDLYDLGV